MAKTKTRKDVEDFFCTKAKVEYISAVLKEKEAGVWGITLSHKQGGWEGESNLMNLHQVPGGFVLMATMRPLCVLTSLAHCVEFLQGQYKCPAYIL